MIKAENITFEYIRRDEDQNVVEIKTALKDVSLHIKKGDFVAILGHNGSGKSTFAKHVNAIFTPEEGTLYVNGMDTKELDRLYDIRKSAGMVFQNPDNQIIATVVEEYGSTDRKDQRAGKAVVKGGKYVAPQKRFAE